jgi:hypothetical protein
MMLSEIWGVKYFLQAVRFAFRVYRKLGITDFQVSIFFYSTAIIIAVGYFALKLPAVASVVPQSLVKFATQQIHWYFLYVTLCMCWGVFFALRLRKTGIVSVDGEITSGLDYSGALKKVTDGFDFIGIGASKLTSNKSDFEAAVSRAHRNGGKVRLLLCDPRADAMKRLEILADVRTGKYLSNVTQSFAVLFELRKQYAQDIEIRIYSPRNDKELVTVRMMFLNQSLCLVSQNVFGKDAKEGRSVAQLHVASKPRAGVTPTFYVAFRRLFDQYWATSTRITDADFAEIAAIQHTQ